LSAAALTVREIAAMLDQAVRDKSYRAAPLGQEVASFLRYKSTTDTAARTIQDYESILARFAAEHAHLELHDLAGAAGAERVVDFVARRWGKAAPGTRRRVFSTISSFFDWAVRFERVASNRCA
jgi:site-specific recombinase XerD